MDRKEAIEVVKKNWPNSGYTRLCEALETLIPELKESEDEKIRKEIISNFNETIDNIRSEEIIPHESKVLIGKMQKWIDWLEKQGEQKHKWSEKDEKMIDNIIDEVYPYGECPDYPTDEERDYYYEHQDMVDWLESLKTQCIKNHK